MHRFTLALFFALLTTVATRAGEPAPSMDRADWASDLDTLYTQMHAIHPSLNHRTSPADMDAYVASFRKTIPTTDWPHYVMGMYRFLALVGDGHTTFYPQPDAGPGFETRYPILPRAFADGVYVVAADKQYADAVGGKIVAVAGRPMADVFKALTQYWDHENESWVLNWTPFMLRRPGYMHGTDVASGDIAAPLVFTIEKNGTRRDVAVAPIPADDDAKGMDSTWLHARDETKIAHPTALHDKDIPFDFVYLADKKAVYAVYNQCADGDKETVAAFATRLFAFIDTHPVDKLIIDIRENGGGDNYKNQPLLLGMIKARDLDKPGHLFVLTSRRTFSAAQNFANQSERWTQALFVGEPTGSSANLYGDAKQFELPKTHLHPMVSTLYWEDSDPKDKRVWLLPDIAAPYTYADYLTGNDPALDAALAYRVDASTPVYPPNLHWRRPSQKADWQLKF